MGKAGWAGAALAGVLLSVAPAGASAAVPAHVRVVDACACGGSGMLTVLVGGRPVAQGLRYQGVLDYVEVGPGEQNIVVTGHGMVGLDADLDPGGYYTIVATGETDQPLLVVPETAGASDQGAAVLHVVRTGDLPGPVQVWLDHGQRIATALQADAAAGPLSVSQGAHEFELYSLSGVLLGRVTCDLTAGQEVTVVLSGSPGGSPDLTAIAATGPQIAAPVPAAPPPPSPSPAAGSGSAAVATALSAGAPAAPPAPSSVPAASASLSGTLPKTGAGPLAALLGLVSIGGGAALLRRRVLS